MRVLEEYYAEALARGFWRSLWILAWGNPPWRKCTDTDGAHTVDDADEKWGQIGRMRHFYCQQNNTVDGADGTPCPTAPLLADEEESETI